MKKSKKVPPSSPQSQKNKHKTPTDTTSATLKTLTPTRVHPSTAQHSTAHQLSILLARNRRASERTNQPTNQLTKHKLSKHIPTYPTIRSSDPNHPNSSDQHARKTRREENPEDFPSGTKKITFQQLQKCQPPRKLTIRRRPSTGYKGGGIAYDFIYPCSSSSIIIIITPLYVKREM